MKRNIDNKISELSSVVSGLLVTFSGLVARDFWLSEPIKYSINSPGKKIRPTLCLLTSELLGITIGRISDFAVSLESIHAASIIHDDLPGLDNDSLRRGMPTCHVKFGEGTALLAGDFLIAEAFGIVLNSKHYTPEQKVNLCLLLHKATTDLCIGQEMDLQAKSLHETSEQELYDRHLKKTGALIMASVLGPLQLLEEKDPIIENALKCFGENLGLLFQVTDDILDATSDSETLGKTAGKDEAVGVPTYVSVYGLNAAKEKALGFALKAKASLEIFQSKGTDLIRFVDFVLERKK